MVKQEEPRFLKWANDAPDHLFFLGAFLLGEIWLFVVRLGFSMPGKYAVLGPVVIIFAYAVIIYFTKRYQIRGDRAADNLYYLGFLFTITALIITLMLYGRTDLNSSNPIDLAIIVDTIIQDLGIALVTTLEGLALRVIFSQMRTDPEELEETSRLALVEAVDKSKSELNYLTNQMDISNRYSAQMLEESKTLADKTKTDVFESLKALTKKLNSIHIPEDLVTTRLNPPLDSAAEAIQSFSSNIQSIEISQDLVEQQVRASFEKLDRKIELETNELAREFATRLSEIDISSDLLISQLMPVLNEFESATRNLATRINAIEISPQILNEAAEQTFGQLREPIQLVAAQITTMPDDMATLQKHFRSLVTLATDTQAQLVGQQEKFSSTLAHFVDATQNLPNLAKGLSQTTESLVEIHNPLDNFNNLLDENANRMRAINTHIEETGARVTENVVAINEAQQISVTTAQKLLAEVNAATSQVQNLTNLIETLATQFADAMRDLVKAADQNTDQR